MNPHRFGSAVFLLGSLVALVLAGCVSPPKAIDLHDASLGFRDRVDWKDSLGPRIAFPGTFLTLRTNASFVRARLSTTGADRVQVVVDGRPASVLVPGNTPGDHALAAGLPAGWHTLSLFKMTEGAHGTLQLFQLEIAPGAVLEPVRPARSIEFIGDSITCGYGNQAAAASEQFAPSNSNAYLSYAAVAARTLGATDRIIAVSGIRLTEPKGVAGMPTVYGQNLPFAADSPVNLAAIAPADAVVINIGTNDFRAGIPDRVQWLAAARSLLDQVRRQNPSALIVLASGPMLPPGDKLDRLREWNRSLAQGRSDAGDRRVMTLDFPVPEAGDGFGADHHPSVRTHARMAELLVATLRQQLGWPAGPDGTSSP